MRPHPPARTAPAPVPAVEPLRVVAACQGHRCRALLQAQEPAGTDALREAAGRSARGVLVSTGCPGLCALGPVATLAQGTVRDGTLHLVGGLVLGPLDPPAVAALAAALEGDDPSALPDVLRRRVLTPPLTARRP